MEQLPADVYITRGIQIAINENPYFLVEVNEAIRRFRSHDWGVVSEEDKKANDIDVFSGGGALGAYDTSRGEIWVDSGGESTVVLFPEEY